MNCLSCCCFVKSSLCHEADPQLSVVACIVVNIATSGSLKPQGGESVDGPPYYQFMFDLMFIERQVRQVCILGIDAYG